MRLHQATGTLFSRLRKCQPLVAIILNPTNERFDRQLLGAQKVVP